MGGLLKLGLCVCVFSMLANSIQAQQSNDTTKIDILGSLKAGLVIPNAIGNSIVQEAYNLKLGYIIEGSVYINENWHLGLQFHQFKGDVNNRNLTGNFDKTRITHWSALAGYSLFGTGNPLSIEFDAGIGTATYRNMFNSENETFKDSGVSFLGAISIGHKLGKTIGVFGRFQYQQDFLNIDAAPPIQNEFKNVAFVMVCIGVKIHIH